MMKQCLQCKKEYKTKPCLIKRGTKFCSRDCKVKYYTGKHLSPNTQFKKGLIPWNKGKKNPYKLDVVKRMAMSHKGKKYGRMSAKIKLKHSLGAKKGKDCNLWLGGVSKKHENLRKTIEYRIWRTEVFERDNYTCVWCGERGGRLNADHIKSYSLYPELRFELSNGQTLCVDCHLEKTKKDMVYITTEVRRRYGTI